MKTVWKKHEIILARTFICWDALSIQQEPRVKEIEQKKKMCKKNVFNRSHNEFQAR